MIPSTYSAAKKGRSPLFSKGTILFLIFFGVLLLSPLQVIGASISGSSPAYLLEDVAYPLNFSIKNDEGFNATVRFSFTGVQSLVSEINLSPSSFSGSHYNGSISILGQNPSDYWVVLNLSNASTGQTIGTINLSGQVNSSMPKVLSSSPSGIVSKESAILLLQTDEVSTCKYGTTNGSYENLSSSFSNTNALKHNQSLTGLSEGSYTYYVRCQDGDGHAMNSSHLIQFTVDLPPTAIITLSDESPVKEGTIEVTLTLSENAASTPTLQYSFDEASTKKLISLSGSQKIWKGYIIITSSENNKVGTFHFSAVDSASNTGTTITSGNLFVVDTEKPIAPQSLRSSVLSSGDVRLEWYYDREDADHFKVYRSTSQDVGYIDSYDIAENSSGSYTDTSALDKVTYYYRISAVDSAGNEGPLSESVYATSISAKTTSLSEKIAESLETKEEVLRVLPPDLVPLVDQQVKKLDKVLLDINYALTKASDQKDAEQKELLEEFEVIKKLEAAKGSLSDLKARAIELKSYYATKEELESKLSQFEFDSRKIEITTPKEISVKERSEFTQTTAKEDVVASVTELLKTSSLTDAEKKTYLKLNEKNKDKVTISTQLKVIEFVQIDGSKKEKSFIKKKITYQEPSALEDVVVFEYIPKSIAADVSEITFLTSNYEVVEADPVVKFGFLKFSSEGEWISYTVDKQVASEEVQQSKTVALLSISSLASESSSSLITGFSIYPLKGLGLNEVQSAIFLGGLLAILLMGGYYMTYLDGFETISRKARRKINLLKLKNELGDQESYQQTSQSIRPSKLPLTENEARLILHELYTHIDSAKKNMADQLLPAVFSVHQKIAQRSQRGEEEDLSVHELLHLARFHLEKENKLKAAQLYQKINGMYSTLPKETKAEIYSQCADLHRLLNQ